MSKYIKNFKTKIDFEGETVLVTLAPITYKDALRFNSLPVIDDGNGGQTISSIEVTQLMLEILPPYIVELSGLTDAEGTKLTAADIFGPAYFTGLVTQIGFELVKAGTPANPRNASEQ